MRSPWTFCRAAALIVALTTVAAPGAIAQDEVDESTVVGGLSFRDQVEVTVVNLDVYVRDDDGNPVTGLTASDFRVFQDGFPQQLTNFAAFDEEVIQAVLADPLPEPMAAPEDQPPPPAEGQPAPQELQPEDIQPVYIVLYVDNENIQPLDRTRVLTQVRRFVSEVMLPHVQVMVVSGGRSMKVVQPFTNDTSQVRDGLREMARLTGARVDLDGQRRDIISDLQRHVERGRDSRRDDYSTRAVLEGDIRNYGEQVVMELDQTIGRIREAAYMVAGLPGRKVMVYISSGLPMVAAKDLITYFGDLFERGSTLPMLSRFDRRRTFRGLAATANAQGLSFYTIDATGLSGAGGVSAEFARPIDPMVAATRINNLQETLLYMADATGGRAILDSNDVTTGLFELKQDLFTYYSLGYTVTSSGADVVHQIKVDLPEHPDYEVLYRRTFVEKSRETEVMDRVASSLSVTIDENPMDLHFGAGKGTPASEDNWMVPIEISIPIEAVALVPKGDDYVGKAVVFVATRDRDGRQSNVQRRPVELRFPASDLEEQATGRYTIELNLLMREGPHRVAVGVLDVITRQASYLIANHRVP